MGKNTSQIIFSDMSQPGGADMHNVSNIKGAPHIPHTPPQAAAILSHLLPKPGGQQAPLQRPSSLPYKDQECQEFVPTVNYIDHEVLIANQVGINEKALFI